MVENRTIAKKMQEYYRNADSYAARLASHTQGAYKEFVGYVSAVLTGGMRLLDLGCGTGLSSIMLAKAGFYVTGADISELFLNFGTRKAEENGLKVDFVSTDASKMSFKDGSFDAVCAFLFLEHAANPLACLQEMKRVVRVHGSIVIVSPNLLSPINRMHDIVKLATGKGGTTFGEKSIPKTVVALFKDAALIVQKKIAYAALFTMREPVLENRFDYVADNDASYLSTPVDLRKWFTNNMFKVVKYQGVGISGRLFPDFASSIHITAMKLQ